MKRFLSIALAMSMMLAAGSGCGNQAVPASSQGSGGSVSAADNAAEAGADAPDVYKRQILG